VFAGSDMQAGPIAVESKRHKTILHASKFKDLLMFL
jgi:hypothetical protein